MPKEEKEGFCTLCRSRCGTINVVEDGRLVEVRANPAHPTGKATCAKGRAAPEIAHSARRLSQPLRRTAPKDAADPGFVPISWDEALSEIASRLTQYRTESGAESVAFAVTSGSSSSTSDALDWIQRFIRCFGSPNTVFSTEICNWHKDVAHAFTFGCGLPTADYRNAGLILLWGHNPANVWLAQAEAISAARAQGAKLAVIDPRQTASARDADQWLRVRPGTDGALALGLARRLIERAAFDRAFVHDWTNASFLVREDDGCFLRGAALGWDDADSYVYWDQEVSGPSAVAPSGPQRPAALSGTFEVMTASGALRCRPAFAHYVEAVAPYDPVTVSAITGVPAGDVEALADLIGAAGSVAYHGWTGLGQHTNASQTERAIATLYALTGSFDRPGGNVRLAAHKVPPLCPMSLMPPGQAEKALGLAQRPLGPPRDGWITSSDFYTAVLDRQPYAVRALFTFGSNLLVSHPGRDRGRAALEALEFQVHCDLFLNPTAATADIILPVSAPWENEALRVGFEITHAAQELVQLRQPIIPHQGDTRSDTWIVFELARRLGLGNAFFGGDISAAYDYVLQPLGLSVAQLRARPGGIRVPLPERHESYRQTGFMTETKRAELYSELLHRHGYPAVPDYVPPTDAPSDAFPLVLFSANNGYFCHSQHRGITALRKRRQEPMAALHPALAATFGIQDGDWMLVQTRRGTMQVRAQLDNTLAEDTVASDYGWWQDAPDLGLTTLANGTMGRLDFNGLIEETLRDPLSGALSLRSASCRVAAANAPGWHGWRPFTVSARRRETEDVTSLRLTPADGASLPGFLPGQFVGFAAGGVHRSYSLISSGTGTPPAYEIAVRHVPGGVASPAIGALEPGDIVELKQPSGRFIIPLQNEFPIVLIAGGIGITPFLSYLEMLRNAPVQPQVTLHYSARTRDSMAFADRLSEYAIGAPWLRLVMHFTRQAEHETGRFSAASVDASLISRRARFYICASDTMIDAVTQGLRARGVPPFEIFSERFRSPAEAAASNLAPRNVRFARSGRVLRWTPDLGSLLDLAENAGLTLPSGCRVGQCESCAVGILSGTAVHATAQDHLDDGQCITCQARPLTDLVLDA